MLDRNFTLAQNILKHIDNLKFKDLSILDYGCGERELLKSFSDLAPNAITEGIELNGQDDGLTKLQKLKYTILLKS